MLILQTRLRWVSQRGAHPTGVFGKHDLYPACGRRVCDKCDNYFSREVERPFLESPALAALRFHQSIPSKKGRIPPLGAVLQPGIPATLHRSSGFGGQVLLIPPQGIDLILRKDGGTLLTPVSPTPPSDFVVSLPG